MIHRIDPVLLDLGVVYLWWYGFSYTAGFTEMFLWLRHQRFLSASETYDLMICLASCVLIGGRAVEVIFYEWPYYSAHPAQIPAFWLGGMSTHGLLLGAAAGAWLFCRLRGHDFLRVADALTVPGALLMGIGRIGNFIDGQIVGSVTDVPWAVKFPDADGFRHPVVLYDGLKNLLLIPLLIMIRNRRPTRGVVLAHFLFWYAFLRIFVDVFREYPTRLFGLATGQSLNLVMSAIGLVLLIWFRRRGYPRVPLRGTYERPGSLGTRMATFAAILIFCLLIPSDWTQDVPKRYGRRHAGLKYSWMYPPVP
ncbi:MAG TPA: prolipoprotein diacylglyceryl transferase [Thermoanaerobaculia bacterium]|nr:prolipoprotein diacylglyceryl transferase [Thermoanaerobaculia bacterium]